MHIYIPSLSRADMVGSRPIDAMPTEWLHSRVSYVVPEEQRADYLSALEGTGVAVLGHGETGIAMTRRWIGEHAQRTGHDTFAMVDDDVGFLTRRGPDDWRLRAMEPPEFVEMMRWVDWHLLDPVLHIAHVGVSAREGNNRAGTGAAPLASPDTRTMRFLAYRTDVFLAMEHGRVQVMEDFDVSLQMLRAGWHNACLYYWAQGQRMSNAPGGCSVWRTNEIHEASARRLAELHPGLVRLRQKNNKTDAGGFGTRTEVTIAWKKALGG